MSRRLAIRTTLWEPRPQSPGRRLPGSSKWRKRRGTNIPVAVIRGLKPGPTLALVAGAHGTEYASIIALEKLIQELNPAEISGTVIVVPLVNIASFEQKVPHVNPVDGKSMNRFYPGNPNGTQTEHASCAMTKQVVEKSDYLIDLHGGDLDESLRPYSYWAPTGNAQQGAFSRHGAGLRARHNHPLNRSPPRSEHRSLSRDQRQPTREAVPHGRGGPCWHRRAGRRDCADQRLPERIALPEDAAGRCASSAEPSVDRAHCQPHQRNRRRFYPTVKRGWYVQPGVKIGYVTDLFGKTVWEARAPSSGVVLYVCAVPSMKKGETVANIGVVAGKAP
jgi:hypothetical protein